VRYQLSIFHIFITVQNRVIKLCLPLCTCV
jgi:hypothetical protein